MIKRGKIPAVRVGRQWRFRKSDVDAWLESRNTSSPPRVLVVDDEASIRDLLSKTLALVGYQVAPDGRSALEQMQRSRYNLLITDLRMPGMDGMAVVHEARRVDADLAVIVVTAVPTEASAIEAANVGVSGYLTKPFKASKLLKITAKALESSRRSVASATWR